MFAALQKTSENKHLSLFKKEREELPRHIAIIMDGNGRWAKKRLMPRIEGHRMGVEAVTCIVKECKTLGIQYLTFFAFSTENWKRPQEEIEKLFEIFRNYLKKIGNDYQKSDIRLKVIGDISAFPEDLQQACSTAEKETENCTGMTLSIALNYGSKAEILFAMKKLCEAKEEITEENLRKYLYTSGQPDPDLIIRTSGEMRLSNFLLFQAAYSELYFTKTLWPDFDEKELHNALKQYSKRDRRFGTVKK